jgi:predicted alpha-1,2-mannosidase
MNSVVVDAFKGSAGTETPPDGNSSNDDNTRNDPPHAEKTGKFSGSWIKVIPEENKVVGYTTRNSGGVPANFRNWFVIVFDAPIAYHTLWLGGVEPENRRDEVSGNHAGAVVSFSGSNSNNAKSGSGHRTVCARVASSFISLEQAERNLQELGDDHKEGEMSAFDEVVEQGRERWNGVLGRIEFPEADKENLDNLRTFYSCLYRSLLFPRDFSEIDSNGNRVHYSPYNGQVLPGEMFTDTGFWDTFRSLFPLLNLLYPEMNARMQAGLVNAWLESGFLPEWASPGHRNCMVGNNSASVVADGWLSRQNGDVTWDIEKLWQAVTHGANAVMPGVSSTGRLGWEYYNDLGYVPCDAGIRESAARTLEYAYNDWCIWQLGRALGKPESETAVYARRALNYRNLFDPETRLMRGRNADGTFQTPFNPLKWGDAFTEGNSLHYTWSVFHDPAGLAELMGGTGEFNAALDRVFTIPPAFDDSYYGYPIHEIREMQVADMGNYAHGNQPIQHMIYLYDWSGEPWKTQAHVREVMRRLYSATPDGYPGDEDNGQTSAWYVFSALGFYPVCPGSGEYALGSPLFRKVVLHLPDGRQLTITARNNSPENIYVNSVQVDGKPSDRNFFTREELTRGGSVTFHMSPEPNLQRGVSETSAPYSLSHVEEQ